MHSSTPVRVAAARDKFKITSDITKEKKKNVAWKFPSVSGFGGYFIFWETSMYIRK